MDQLLQKTLELVNQAREWMGLPILEKLPKGVSGFSRWCPIGQALCCYVGDTAIWYWERHGSRDWAYQVAKAWGKKVYVSPNQCGDTAYMVDMPEELQEFVRRFDSGEYPELVCWWF